MTCSDEEREVREIQAWELGLSVGADLAWFPGCIPYSYVCLSTLVVHVGGARHGPFTTMREAVNMLTLLGGGPK